MLCLVYLFCVCDKDLNPISFIYKIISLKFNFICSAQTNNMCRIDWCLEMSCISPQYWFFSTHLYRPVLKRVKLYQIVFHGNFHCCEIFSEFLTFLKKKCNISFWLVENGKNPFSRVFCKSLNIHHSLNRQVLSIEDFPCADSLY